MTGGNGGRQWGDKNGVNDLDAALILALTHTDIGCDRDCRDMSRVGPRLSEDAKRGHAVMWSPRASLATAPTEEKHPKEGGESSVNSGEVGRAVSALAAMGRPVTHARRWRKGRAHTGARGGRSHRRPGLPGAAIHE